MLPFPAFAQLIGPIEFDTDSEYDDYFKEAAQGTEIHRDDRGYLTLQGSPLGLAVYDRSSSGGSNGNGGTSGNDDDEYFDEIMISSWISCSDYHQAQFRAGYLLRLDENEDNGYLVQITSLQDNYVAFEIYEGSGFPQRGNRIFRQEVALDSLRLETDTWYAFKVSLVDGTFTMDFANGEANATFTDTSISAHAGQVGLLLETANPYIAVHMDSYAVDFAADMNRPPADIRLNNNRVEENERRVTEVGQLDSLDLDLESTVFTYSLVGGEGDDGNSFFSIEENTLLTNKSFNYEAASSYSIRIRSTDSDGEYREKIFPVEIVDRVESAHRILEFYQLEPNHFILKWPLHAGYAYQVKKSATLLPDSWEDHDDPVIEEDGASLVNYHLRTEPGETSLFFKVDRSELP